MSNFTLHHGDCLKVMPTLAAGSVAMVFADLPYALSSTRRPTANKWDRPFNLNSFWQTTSLIRLRDSVVIATGTQPFTSRLVASNETQFWHALVWSKGVAANFANAKIMPLKVHEDIVVFRNGKATYNPQMVQRAKAHIVSGGFKDGGWLPRMSGDGRRRTYDARYPTSLVQISARACPHRGLHPTQKPLALLEWLVATYTNPGDTVLDPVMGSGTTGHACANLGRKFIGIEKDAAYFAGAKSRIEKAYADAANGPQQGALAV